MKGVYVSSAQRAGRLGIAFEIVAALFGLIVATATLIIIRIPW